MSLPISPHWDIWSTSARSGLTLNGHKFHWKPSLVLICSLAIIHQMDTVNIGPDVHHNFGGGPLICFVLLNFLLRLPMFLFIVIKMW